MRKQPAYVWAGICILLPLMLMTYRVVGLGYPLLPVVSVQVWQLTIEGRASADDQGLTVALGLPLGHMVSEERVTSGSLRFTLRQEGPNRMGVWSGPRRVTPQSIVYQTTLLVPPRRHPKVSPPQLPPYPTEASTADQQLAERLVAKWRRLTPRLRLQRVEAFVAGEWGKSAPTETDLQAWETLQETYGQQTILRLLLRAAELPNRLVEGLQLTESVSTTPLTWLEVWTGRTWDHVRPITGEIDTTSATLLPLTRNDVSAIRVTHGEVTDLRYVLSRQIMSAWRHHYDRIWRSDRWLDRWSLFHLPLEFQETFRILLLVPIGALMIGGLRNLVGFPTFGIFMPVLMALAFRNTGWFYGLGIFAVVVGIGYILRRLLDALRRIGQIKGILCWHLGSACPANAPPTHFPRRVSQGLPPESPWWSYDTPVRRRVSSLRARRAAPL